MPITENFSVPAGDDVLLDFVVYADEGVTLDGATVKWRAYATRLGLPIDTALIEKQTGGEGIEITDPAERLFTVALDAADTEALRGRYYHEAEVTDAAGNHETVTVGIMTITRTVIPNVEATVIHAAAGHAGGVGEA